MDLAIEFVKSNRPPPKLYPSAAAEKLQRNRSRRWGWPMKMDG